MKILIASSYDDSWNSVRPEAEIFIKMAELGHKITIVTQGYSEYVSRFLLKGLKVIDCYPRRKIDYRTIKTIRQELVTSNYDIVYAMNSRTIPNAAFACVNLPVKLVTYRGTSGGLSRYDPSAYLTHLHPRVDAIICIADAATEAVRKQVWIAKEKVVTIYKGHDLSWYNLPKANRKEFSISNDSFVGICVANARPVKGIEVLVAASHFLAENNDLHILLVGKDFDKEPYRSLIEASPMSKRLHVTGYRKDVPALIAASDLIIQPSLSNEGLPKTVIEGMALSVPAVVTTAGGCKELVVHERTGFIVAPSKVKELADKITILYQDRDRTTMMGTEARKRVQDTFAIEKSVTSHLAFFSTLLSKKS